MKHRHSAFVLVALVALVALGAGAALWSRAPQTEEEQRRDYEAMLAAHPFMQRDHRTPRELKAAGVPKKDRPDLAAEQDFLLTMDPATGTVPIELLWAANRSAVAAKRSARQAERVTTAWQERGPSNVAGRTRALMFDPNDASARKVWAGGVDGGLWYTDDVTATPVAWTGVDDFWANLAVSAIAYDPTDTRRLYVGTGEGWFNFDAVQGAGIFASADGGTTWALLPSTQNANFRFVLRLAVHPLTGDIYAGTTTGVWRSADDGGSWEQVLTGVAGDVAIASDGRIYVGFGRIFSAGSVWSSPSGDSGTWARLSNGTNGFPTTGYNRVEIAVAPTDPDVLYAITQNAATYGIGGVYKTEDGGATWTEITTLLDLRSGRDFSNGQAWYDISLEVSPDSPDQVVAGAINLFRSLDGGTTWTQISQAYGPPTLPYVHPDQHGVAFRPGVPGYVLFSNDGGLYATEDLSAAQPAFQSRNNGYNVTQFYSAAIAPEAGSDVMLGGTQDNGTHRYDTPGIDATDEVYGGDGGFTFIDQTASRFAIASYVYNNFYRSIDGGLTFTLTLLNEGNTGFFINFADYDDREDILYTSRDLAGIWRVSGISSAFTRAVVPLALLSPATHLRVSPYAPPDSSTLFLGTISGRVFKATGVQGDAPTLTQINAGAGMPGGAISCIEVGRSEDHLIVTYSNYNVNAVWETTDGGQRWARKEGNLPRIPVRWALFNPNDRNGVILATESGIYETTDFSAATPTWTPAPSFPTVRVDMLQWRESDGAVMAATHGRGVFTAAFRDNLVADEAGPRRPDATHTLAASPNPFRERSLVTLEVAESQRVRAEVFGVDGRRVGTLFDGEAAAGRRYELPLDGRGLAAGTYIVSVRGERFRDRLRITRLR